MDVGGSSELGRCPARVAPLLNRTPEVIQVLEVDAGAVPNAGNIIGGTAWDLIHGTEALQDTKSYWGLHDLRFE